MRLCLDCFCGLLSFVFNLLMVPVLLLGAAVCALVAGFCFGLVYLGTFVGGVIAGAGMLVVGAARVVWVALVLLFSFMDILMNIIGALVFVSVFLYFLFSLPYGLALLLFFL